MSEENDKKKSRMGENLSLEWAAETYAGSLWDAIELAETDSNLAVEKMKGLAANGSSLSMFYLGDFYTFGRFGIGHDFKEAEYWLRHAASNGSIEGAYLLARHLEEAGKYEEAEIEYRKLSDRGFSPALFALGVEYFKGDRLRKDIKKSIEYLERAEELGHLHAKHRLWFMYRNEGLGFGYKIRGWLKWFTLIIPFALCKVNYPNSDRLRL